MQRCQCYTLKKTQCSFKAKIGSEFCGKHNECEDEVMNGELYVKSKSKK